MTSEVDLPMRSAGEGKYSFPVLKGNLSDVQVHFSRHEYNNE